MSPPGRRRSISPLSVLLSALLLFSSTASAASAVLGLDLGTEYIKAVLVKPGLPLEIVLSKDSKRKETAAVAFKPPRSGSPAAASFPERLYGGDALALAARFPGEVYPNLKQLLGIPLKSLAVEEFRKRYPAIEVAESSPRGTTAFKSKAFHSDELPFAVEELLAMELKNVKENAQALAGKAHKVANAVFTIPPFFTAEERKALDLAAQLAGLNVLGMMTDGMAVGLNYATSRTFPSVTEGGKPEHHLVFDMGAGSTTATVLRMQGKTVKDVGKFNKTIQEVTVVGAGWDRTLGGDVLNTVIVDDMVKKFLETPSAKKLGKTEEDVKKHGRAMARMWKDAERLRQVLSANQETVASFEDLFQDVDFKYKFSRTAFEEATGLFAHRLDIPIVQALEAANLDFSDINSVILHGGATRTPFVQKKLETLVGDAAKLRSNVNADEAAVFGAAFRAAQISPSFRVKEIVANDAAGYATYLEWTDGKKKSQKLFTTTSSIGYVKQVPFKQMNDFTFSLYQPRGAVEAGVADTPPATYKIETKNLTASVKQLEEKFGCKVTDITNTFSVRLDPIRGLPEVVRGVVSCEYEVTDKKAGVVDGVKGLFGFGGKKEQEPLKEGEESTSSSSSSSSSKSKSSSDSKSTSSAKDSKSAKAAKEDKTPAPPKKKTETININFTVSCEGCKDIDIKEVHRMQDRLTAFDASDKARRTREEDLNNLEGFTYKARDIMADDGFIRFSTAAHRNTLEKLLTETSQWLSEESSKAESEILKSKLKALKDLVNPVQKRKSEAGARPEAIKKFEDTFNTTSSLANAIKYSLEMAESASSSAASSSSEASKSASEASTETTTSTTSSEEATSETPSADPLQELEEDAEPATSSSTSTTTTPIPEPTEEPILSPYTQEDYKSILSLHETTKKWFDEMLAAQAKLTDTDDPAFLVRELVEKAEKLNTEVMAVFAKQMKMPKARTFKPPKATKSKKAKAAAKSSSSSSASSASATTVKGENAEESTTVTFEVPKESGKAEKGRAGEKEEL
ncbi:actin-like ATPase domain-containing protein [Tothia fuscella]|uniref:Actin-like ATPase domain-containing protein n=1 Tax=Tothia fuscella TaxID=1048955 RepID=A0A9P4NJ06_9PEZI|nr:actin-like ATPase domain-containing protein [Tothia fuscella]